MRLHVADHVLFQSEAGLTIATEEGALVRVGAHVLHKAVLSAKVERAVLTLEQFLLHVAAHMLL